MAYARRGYSSRRTTRNYSGRSRAPARRATARRSSGRSRSSAGNTVRLVIEHTGMSGVARSPSPMLMAGALPKKARY